MDVWNFDMEGDEEYEEDYDKLERLQEMDLETDGLDLFSTVGARVGKEASRKKGGGQKKTKKGKRKNKKNFLIPNENNVKIRSWGEIMLFNVSEDPEERHDLSSELPDMVESLKARAVEHFYRLKPRHVPEFNRLGDPKHWGGYWSPGWCDLYNVQ